MRRDLKVTPYISRIEEPGTVQRASEDQEHSGAKEHRGQRREYSVLSNKGGTVTNGCVALPLCQHFRCARQPFMQNFSVFLWRTAYVGLGWKAGDLGVLTVFAVWFPCL